MFPRLGRDGPLSVLLFLQLERLCFTRDCQSVIPASSRYPPAPPVQPHCHGCRHRAPKLYCPRTLPPTPELAGRKHATLIPTLIPFVATGARIYSVGHVAISTASFHYYIIKQPSIEFSEPQPATSTTPQ